MAHQISVPSHPPYSPTQPQSLPCLKGEIEGSVCPTPPSLSHFKRGGLQRLFCHPQPHPHLKREMEGQHPSLACSKCQIEGLCAPPLPLPHVLSKGEHCNPSLAQNARQRVCPVPSTPPSHVASERRRGQPLPPLPCSKHKVEGSASLYSTQCTPKCEIEGEKWRAGIPGTPHFLNCFLPTNYFFRITTFSNAS